jgi:hypothetical protein
VEHAAVLQHASHLAQRRLLLALPQVMQHEGGEHALEGAVGVGQRVAEPLVERQHDPRPVRLAPGARERRGVGIDAHDGDPGMSPRDQQGQAAGAAAEVEHALAGLERGLLHERRPGGAAAEQPVDGVVERQQPAAAGRRQEPAPVSRVVIVRHDFSVPRA